MLRGATLRSDTTIVRKSLVKYHTVKRLPNAYLGCGEGQTKSRACVLFTEREVSFRVEASARTMTKESS